MLQRNPSQKEPAGSRTEDKDQRKNPQRSEKDCSKQEKIKHLVRFLTDLVQTVFFELNEVFHEFRKKNYIMKTGNRNRVICFKNRNNGF